MESDNQDQLKLIENVARQWAECHWSAYSCEGGHVAPVQQDMMWRVKATAHGS